MAKTTLSIMHIASKTFLNNIQKVAKILTIFWIYGNNTLKEIEMVRLFEKKLFDWKESGMKKPLMVIRSKTNWKNIYN